MLDFSSPVAVGEVLDPLTGELHSAQNVPTLVSVFKHLDSFSRQVDEAKQRICDALRGKDERGVWSDTARCPATVSLCSVAQKLELRRLRMALGMGEQQWRELLELHGVRTAHDLTDVQAADLMRLLQLRSQRHRSLSVADGAGSSH